MTYNYVIQPICYCPNNTELYTRLKDSSGWQLVFTSPHIESCIERVAVNAKLGGGGGSSQGEAASKMVAISYANHIRLWGISEHGARTNIGELCFKQMNECDESVCSCHFYVF